jgi:hypothetical protein
MAYSDCWSDVLRSQWANLLVFLDHRKGAWDDYSSYARTVTQTATGGVNCETQQGDGGKSLSPGGGSSVTANHGRLVVSAAADLAITQGTVVFLGNWGRSLGANARLCEMRAAGTYFDVYAPLTTGIDWFDGSGGHAFSFPTPAWETTRSIAFLVANGTLPRCFHNGVSLGTAGASSPLAGGVVPTLNLYNYNTGAVADQWWRFFGFLLFSARLSPAEISQLHNDFVESAHYL